MIISLFILPNNNAETTKVNTKIIPAPLGFPAERAPSCAYCLPMSFGRYPFNFAIAIQVAAKANKTPIKATSACSYVPNKYIILSSFGLSPNLPDLDSQYQNGSLAINLNLKGNNQGYTGIASMLRTGRSQPPELRGRFAGDVSTSMEVENPHKWSAEDIPYLYTLRATVKEGAARLVK